MNNNKPYVLSPYALLLRDKPNIFNGRPRLHTSEQALKLEQYVNDLYHHFLYILTKEMQSAEISDEARIQSLFEELVKAKKKLQSIDS